MDNPQLKLGAMLMRKSPGCIQAKTQSMRESPDFVKGNHAKQMNQIHTRGYPIIVVIPGCMRGVKTISQPLMGPAPDIQFVDLVPTNVAPGFLSL